MAKFENFIYECGDVLMFLVMLIGIFTMCLAAAWSGRTQNVDAPEYVTNLVPAEQEIVKVYQKPIRYLSHGYYDGEELILDNTVLAEMAKHFIYNTDGQTFDDKCCSVGNVWVALEDGGTPDDFRDDIVLKSWTDKASDITDRLETKMSENSNWTVTRTGNELHIDVQEGN